MSSLDECLAIIRPHRCRSAAAYSRQTFAWTICRSVCTYVRRSVCPVHCGKTADQIRMPFGIIGRTGPGIREVVGFGDRSTGRGTFGANLGRAVVTDGDFTAYLCYSAATWPSSQITFGRLLLYLYSDFVHSRRIWYFVANDRNIHLRYNHRTIDCGY